MKLYSFLAVLAISAVGFAQDKMPYRLFDKYGDPTSYKKLLKEAGKAEVVFFGEHHDNAIIHWLELELTKDLAENHKLVLGAEMIEADNQKQLNQPERRNKPNGFRFHSTSLEKPQDRL